ncbi:MAG: HEAT repeat domain-containing protein, partial [Leptolyngbyaceae cyanobacterium]
HLCASCPAASSPELARGWKDDPDTLTNLKTRARDDENWAVRRAAVKELARGWKDDNDTLTIHKTRARDDENGDVRSAAVKELARGWKADLTLLELYRGIALHDPFERESDWQDNPRQLALNTLITQFSQSLDARALLADRAAHDPDEPLRQWAQKQLEKIQN